MSGDLGIVLSPRTSQGLPKLSDDIDGGIVHPSKDLHGNWSEHYALCSTCLAVLANFLLISVGERMTRLNSRTINQLGLEARHNAYVKGLMLASSVVGQQDVRGALTARARQQCSFLPQRAKVGTLSCVEQSIA